MVVSSMRTEPSRSTIVTNPSRHNRLDSSDLSAYTRLWLAQYSNPVGDAPALPCGKQVAW
jgi:hypothetical protein